MTDQNGTSDTGAETGTSKTDESTGREATASRRGLLRALGAGGGTALALSGPTMVGEESLVATAAAKGDGPSVGVGALPRDQLDGYEDWLGREVDVVSINPGLVSWSHLEAERWAYGIWHDVIASRDDCRMATWVPMKPRDTGSLSAAASGEYDEHYAEFARNMVEMGLEDAILRIAPEFSGRWSPDYAGDDPEAWKEAFRRIVRTTRNVDGTAFEYNWNPNYGNDSMDDPRNAYPGDEYVTEIGVDIYDSTWLWEDGYYPDDCDQQCRRTRQEQAWENMKHVRNGLNDWRDFAEDHGKPLTFPEWGLNFEGDGGVEHGGGDDPYFVEQMHDWMHRNDVRWHAYFNASGSELYLPDSEPRFPNAAATYRRLFGAN